MSMTPTTEEAKTKGQEPKGAWMQTFCLPHFPVLDPDPSQILIEDIAHHLSQNVRYGGAGIRFLSVAEHSVHMARAAAPEDALWALLHDASEAYLHDVVRPVKRALSGYSAAEDRIMRAICEQFGLSPKMPAAVKRLDNRILIDETRQNMRPSDVVWSFGGETEPLGVTLQFWTPEQAEREFLATFTAITGQTVTLPALAAPRADSAESTAEERARLVCNKEQMEVWTSEIAGDLSMGGWFREDISYDDKLAIRDTIADDIRSIVGSAFDLTTPAPSSPGVPDSVREAFLAADLHECWVNGDTADVMTSPFPGCGNFNQIVARCATGDLWRKRAVAIAEALNFVRTLSSAHPAGQSTGQGAERLTRAELEPHINALEDWLVAKGGLGAWAAGTASRRLLLAEDSPLCLKPAPDSTRTGKVETVSVPIEPTEEMMAAGAPFTDDFHSVAADAYHAMLAARPAAPEAQGAEHVRDVKRGTEYEVLGEAEAQVSEGMKRYDMPGATRLINDGSLLTVYRDSDGKLWCRFTDEFRDGRFEPAPPASSGQESA